MTIIGINLGIKETQATFFDSTCIKPMVIATINGYGTFSEESVLETFLKLKKKTGDTEAVVAVNGCFNIGQRQMIKDIGLRAGFRINRIIHKSSSIGLAYEFYRTHEERHKEKELLLCNIEKDYFEVAIADVGQGVVEIQAIDWENNFNDIDTKCIEELFEKIISERERQLIEKSVAKGETTKDIKFTSEQIDAVIITGDSSHLRQVVKKIFKKEPETNRNEEEFGIIGAGIQGAILSGHTKDVFLLDITSKSIGIEILNNNNMEIIIPHNTTIPTRKSKVFSVDMHRSTIVDINVFEGEKKTASQNQLIGKLSIPSISLGKSEIEVEMDIDVNSNIHITAKDSRSGKEYKSRI